MSERQWLTLSEMARKAELSEPRAREILKDFGNMFCARQFADINEYPAQAVELMAFIKRRIEQGWSLESLRDLIYQLTKIERLK